MPAAAFPCYGRSSAELGVYSAVLVVAIRYRPGPFSRPSDGPWSAPTDLDAAPLAGVRLRAPAPHLRVGAVLGDDRAYRTGLAHCMAGAELTRLEEYRTAEEVWTTRKTPLELPEYPRRSRPPCPPC